LCGSVGALLVAFAHRPRINESAFNHIVTGQTIEDVCRIIGVPPGDYGSAEGSMLVPGPLRGYASDIEGHRFKEWIGEDVAIRVRFSEEGVVVDKMLVPVIHFEPTTWEKVMKWLKSVW
jgi:hypothetical protein